MITKTVITRHTITKISRCHTKTTLIHTYVHAHVHVVLSWTFMISAMLVVYCPPCKSIIMHIYYAVCFCLCIANVINACYSGRNE